MAALRSTVLAHSLARSLSCRPLRSTLLAHSLARSLSCRPVGLHIPLRLYTDTFTATAATLPAAVGGGGGGGCKQRWRPYIGYRPVEKIVLSASASPGAETGVCYV